MAVKRFIVFSYAPPRDLDILSYTPRDLDIAQMMDGHCDTLDEAKDLPAHDETHMEVYDTHLHVWHRFHRISEADARTDVWVETTGEDSEPDVSVDELRRRLSGRGPKLD